MTDAEAIAAVRRGERVAGSHSLHAAEAEGLVCSGVGHRWRVLYCDGEADVCECLRCGKQEVFRCDFDEDYA